MRAIGEKWRDGRVLRGSTKTENRMEGRMPVRPLPSSAGLVVIAVVVEEEVAMTVPVVADLDRVILRRPVDSCSLCDVVAAVANGGGSGGIGAVSGVDCVVLRGVPRWSSSSLSEGGLSGDGGLNEGADVGTSVKRRESVGRSTSLAEFSDAATGATLDEEAGASEVDRARVWGGLKKDEFGETGDVVVVGEVLWSLDSRWVWV